MVDFYQKSSTWLQVVDPEVEMINPADWDVVCDVRTPDEFEEDHLIGAINTPVLSNKQRAEIGTLYKQMYVLVQLLTCPALCMLILGLACTLHRLPELFISLQRIPSPLSRLCYQGHTIRAMLWLVACRGQHEAKRRGAALISRNISDILLNHFQEYGKDLKVLVYCWRGGERSQSLAHVLSRVGWEVTVVKRGYMGYRNQVSICNNQYGKCWQCAF